MKTKYIWLLAVLLGISACSSDDDDSTANMEEPKPALIAGDADFSKYVAVGASFSAGFTDNALFIAGQENSFPNMLSQKFELVGGGSFNQPLMSDNIGGFLFGGMPLIVDGKRQVGPRLFFKCTGATPLPVESTTEGTTVLSVPINDDYITRATRFQLGIARYGTFNDLAVSAGFSPTATGLGDAVVQKPTFF